MNFRSASIARACAVTNRRASASTDFPAFVAFPSASGDGRSACPFSHAIASSVTTASLPEK